MNAQSDVSSPGHDTVEFGPSQSYSVLNGLRPRKRQGVMHATVEKGDARRPVAAVIQDLALIT